MSRRKPPEISEEDWILWQKVAKTVERAVMPDAVPPAEQPIKASGVKAKAAKSAPPHSPAVKKAKTYQPPAAPGTSLDRRTEQRLRQGKITIDETIDLHGMTQEAAHNLLNRRLTAAHQSGRRLVLVITGKGLRSSAPGGILRNALGLWCAMPPLSDIILKRVTAQPKDGGSGAFYIYLRRLRA